MAATQAQIEQLRRMVAEPTSATYSFDDLAAYIEAYPLLDSAGVAPGNSAWSPTYDLHAAAGDIWEEKAAAYAALFDFSADGSSFQRSQQYLQMMQQARYHRSRRSPRTGTLIKWPEEGRSPMLGIVNRLHHND